MAITQGLVTSFKVGLLNAQFNFGASTTQVFKLALYSSTANLGPATTVYTTTGEVVGTGYIAGGATLTISQAPTSSGKIAFMGFATPSWSGATLTARGGLIYLYDGLTNPAVAVLNFGADKTANNQTFSVPMPANLVDTALIRIK